MKGTWSGSPRTGMFVYALGSNEVGLLVEDKTVRPSAWNAYDAATGALLKAGITGRDEARGFIENHFAVTTGQQQ